LQQSKHKTNQKIFEKLREMGIDVNDLRKDTKGENNPLGE
jgi:hypothetical protein